MWKSTLFTPKGNNARFSHLHFQLVAGVDTGVVIVLERSGHGRSVTNDIDFVADPSGDTIKDKYSISSIVIRWGVSTTSYTDPFFDFSLAVVLDDHYSICGSL